MRQLVPRTNISKSTTQPIRLQNIIITLFISSAHIAAEYYALSIGTVSITFGNKE